jgi:nitrite reductase (cytochrome c-552)
MPYISEGGQKFTSHHVVSPLENVSNSCQVCHRQETERLVRDVYERQDKILQIRSELEKLLVRAHLEAKAAWDYGAKEEQMKDILTDIRHAQWRWDYATASHGASFHSPVEVSRIISTGIVIAQDARVRLARLLASMGHNAEIPYPDIETKAKAQAFIGLKMEQLNSEKQEFLKTIVPKWIEEGKEREKSHQVETMN